MSASFATEGSTIHPKYANFTILDVPYKHVNNVPIEVSILIPKDLNPNVRHPVTVRWHGGGFGTGTRLFPDWYATWTLSFPSKHSSVILSPDYRLLPEARGRDILSDCSDFFEWLLKPGNLSGCLPGNLEVDLENLFVMGESAGGWMALQSGFAETVKGKIRAVVAAYPMIELEGEHFSKDYEKKVGSPAWPRVDEEVVRGYVKGLKGGEVVTGRTPPEGGDLTMGMIQRGMYSELFGEEEELLPLKRVGTVKEYPPLWIFHGTKDTIVPIGGTEKFVDKFRNKFPDGKLHVSIVEGEEHGFDDHDAATGAPATLDRDWVRPGVAFVEQFWPKSK